MWKFINRAKYYSGAVSFVALLAGVYSLPLNAQTSATENEANLENVVVEDDLEWSFPSENEPASVKDDIKELEEYSITEESDSNLGLTEEESDWGNQGDVENRSFEIEVYDY